MSYEKTFETLLGKHTFIFANMSSCTVSGTDPKNRSLFPFRPRNSGLYVSENVRSSLFTLQACTSAFCKGIAITLSMRHRFTVAENERLFLFIYFCPLCFLSNETVTWSVPENQQCTIRDMMRKTVIIQSIVLVFGAPRVCSWWTQIWYHLSNKLKVLCLELRASLIV